MDISLLTESTLRDALRDIRYSRSLAGNPVLGLDAITVRLRAECLADSPPTREWIVGRLLNELVTEALGRLRPATWCPFLAPDDDSPQAEVQRLKADFAIGSPSLEAWSILRCRYLSTQPLQMEEMAAALGVGARTLARRLTQGHEMLVARLREVESAAAREVTVAPGAPVSQRIVPDGSAEAQELVAAMSDMLAAVRDDARVLHLPPERLQEIGSRVVADIVEYRLGRIAQWSDERYALDERFVGLTLLVDRGDDAAAGRWAVSEKRYGSLLEVLADVDDPALVLLGPPGCGKSTLLRRFELDTAVDGLREVGEKITFFVSLNTYRGHTSNDPPPPGAWLAEQWAARFAALPPLDELLAEGRMVLLLDALNEMPHRGSADYRERILGWKQYLHGLVARGRGNRVLFSCRSLDYSAPLSTPALRVPQVQIEPMRDDQVRRFLEKYVPARADRLWAELAGTPPLDLLRTPYFLRLLVEEAEATGMLQTGRAALFTSFVRRALKREIERDNRLFQPDSLLAERDYERMVTAARWRDPHELPQRGRLFPALAALAFGMQETRMAGMSGQLRVPYDEAMALLADEPASLVLRAGAEIGVLDEDRDRDEVLFRHQLLQEYFAARHVAAKPDRAPRLVASPWRIADVSPSVAEVIDATSPAEELPPLPQTGWEETSLLAGAMVADKEAFLRAMEPENLVLAGRLAAQSEVRAQLSDRVLRELGNALALRSRDPEADLRHRIACAYAAGELGDPRFEEGQGPDGRYLSPPTISLPAGVYPIGDDQPLRYHQPLEGDPEGTSDHVPRHEVEIAATTIGQFPVTNAEWACFMDARGYDDERWWDTPDAQRWRRGELPSEGLLYSNRYWRRKFEEDPELFERMVASGAWPASAVERWREWIALDARAFEQVIDEHCRPQRRTEPRFWQDRRFNRPAQPVVGICWFEARAYCAWLSAQCGRRVRLPTEVEWEAAARGRDARRFPWGDTFDRLRANCYQTHIRATTPIGVFPEGDTPEGIADMSGNVYEWTSSLLGPYGDVTEVRFPYPYRGDDGREDPEAAPNIARIIRGGSWNDGEAGILTFFRYVDHPDHWMFYVGFRVVVEQP